LDGETLAEVDENAAALARLLERRRVEERTVEPPGPFDDMAGARARRKAQLASIFTGGAVQARDPRGRFAGTAAFHGGAREQPVPRRGETHDETLSRLLRTGEANAGGRF